MGTFEHALKCTDDIRQIGNDRVNIGEHLCGLKDGALLRLVRLGLTNGVFKLVGQAFFAEGDRGFFSSGTKVDESELGGGGFHILDLFFDIDTSDNGSGDEGVHVVVVL